MNSEREASAAGFDDDAIMEILVRLPIEYVIRFQIVCKKWQSLISSDHFRRLHTLRHHKPPVCLIYITEGKSLCYFNTVIKPTKIIPLSLNNIPVYSESFRPIILSCCNGLVLCGGPYDFYVYNPMTRQSRKIILPRTVTYIYLSKLHLVFDPSKSPHYKIVYIRAEEDSLTYTIEVFSSESGTWKTCMKPISNPFGFCFGTSVCCNNKIYGTKRYGDGCIYCIDIDKNVLRLLESLTVEGRSHSIASIQEWDGYLYYVTLYLDDSGNLDLACLWEKAKDDDDKWCLKYEDRLPPVLVRYIEMSFFPQTSTLLFTVHPNKCMAYNFLDKSCIQLLNFSLQQQPICGSRHLFRQTLAPV